MVRWGSILGSKLARFTGARALGFIDEVCFRDRGAFIQLLAEWGYFTRATETADTMRNDRENAGPPLTYYWYGAD